MNSQNLFNLSEAYFDVYQNIDEEEQSSMPPRRSAAERKKRAKELGDRQTIRGIVSDHNKKRQPSRQEDPEKYYPKEQVDLYDIILSHLLDEGYAETQEQAEVMMVHMSEEWRESIVEAASDQSNKQIERGIKTTYKAGNVLDNQHQGRSTGLNKLPASERRAKTERMRERLKTRRNDLFKERGNREDAAREELKKKYGI
jgi:hypothetical protein